MELFQEGDLLLARDEHDPSDPLVLKRIEEIFVRQAFVIELVVRGRTIGTTAEHPIYVVERNDFVAAGEIEIGETFISHDGQLVQLAGVNNTGRQKTVYNFRIADFHTYFVGGKEWGFSVWVHNTYDVKQAAKNRHAEYSKDINRINATLDRMGARALREAGKNTTNGWKSEALFRKYAQAVDNRLRRNNCDYFLLAEPAAMPGTQIRAPTGISSSKPANPYDGFPGVWSRQDSRRLDIGVAVRTPGVSPGLSPIVSGFDISHKPMTAKGPISGYYQEAFGNIPIFDIRPL